MEKVLVVIKVIIEQGPAYLGAIVAVLSALAALFMLIPGEQPEKTLYKIVDFLAKFSKKPEKLEE